MQQTERCKGHLQASTVGSNESLMMVHSKARRLAEQRFARNDCLTEKLV